MKTGITRMETTKTNTTKTGNIPLGLVILVTAALGKLMRTRPMTLIRKLMRFQSSMKKRKRTTIRKIRKFRNKVRSFAWPR